MSLAKRSLRSSGYMIASSGFQAVVQLARSILLARLLLPENYGVYTYAASFVMLTYALPGFGIGAAMVHRTWQSDGEIARRVQFTLNVILNAIWALVMVFGLSWFFDEEYRWVFWVILATQVADNLTGVARAKLSRGVSFRRIALIEGVNTLIGSGVAVFLAWRGAGLWSLVSTDIIAAGIGIFGFYIIRPVWQPRFGWSREVAVYLLDFGRRSLGSIVLLQALDRVDDLWAGAFLGDAQLGYYSRAYTFATYPRKVLASPISRVAMGTYAALKDKPKRLSQAFFRVNAFLIRSGFLLSGLLFLLIPEFIHFVIGDKWLPMMTPFRLMLLYTLLDPVKITIGNVFIALGKPEKLMRARIWQLVTLLIGLFTLGPLLGINGVALSVDIMLVIGIIILLWQVQPYVKFSVKALFGVPVLALGLSLLTSLLTISWLLPEGDLSLLSVLLKSIAFSVPYIVILIAVERDQWLDIFTMGIILFFKNRGNPGGKRDQ